MDVILLERIEKLGQMGDVVTVKPGYARNYLLPQNKALRATKNNLTHFDTQRAQLEANNLKKREQAQAVMPNLDGMSVVLVRQASDSDQLYGSVTTRDIALAISEGGVTVDKTQVLLDRPIKTVGLHPVRVRLHPEVSVTVTANVARSPEEAEAQARGERPGAELDEDDEPDAAEVAEAFFEGGAVPEDDAADEPQAEEPDQPEADDDQPQA
jgi:large subunit ribosomal protein L9